MLKDEVLGLGITLPMLSKYEFVKCMKGESLLLL
jgi:hypothetical protein